MNTAVNSLIISAIFLLSPNALSAEEKPSQISPAQEKPVAAFSAQYTIFHKGDTVGKAVRKLDYTESDKINYSYQTDIKWLIFTDRRKEQSTVTIKDNIVTPYHYIYKRSGTGPDKHYEWLYFPNKNQATNIDKNGKENTIEVDFSTPLQDKLSYHLQQRLQLKANPKQKHFVYSVLQNSGNNKHYVYEVEGEEELILPYGNIKTIKLKREVVEKKKITYAWFAPELDYLLVRLYQQEGGVAQFEAQLDKYTTH